MLWALVLLLVPLYYFARYLCELVELPDLRKRAVFITGADSGFGRLLVIKCAANGLNVFAGCLTEKGVEELKAETRGLPGTLRAIQVDIRSEESVQSAVNCVNSNLQGGQYLWAIVNNAGVYRICPDAWTTLHDYEETINVNLYGMIRVTHAFLPLLKSSRGRVISVSSVAGRYALANIAPYSISKFGIEAYMDSIRREYRPFGIRCSILEPGAFKSGICTPNLLANGIEHRWNHLPEELKEEYGEEFKDKLIQGFFKGFDSASSDRLDYVVDAYYHAITARWPRNRYRCGWQAILVYIPLTFLPTELEDLALRYLKGSNPMPAGLRNNVGKAD